jgi:hypothetical protein
LIHTLGTVELLLLIFGAVALGIVPYNRISMPGNGGVALGASALAGAVAGFVAGR